MCSTAGSLLPIRSQTLTGYLDGYGVPKEGTTLATTGKTALESSAINKKSKLNFFLTQNVHAKINCLFFSEIAVAGNPRGKNLLGPRA